MDCTKTTMLVLTANTLAQPFGCCSLQSQNSAMMINEYAEATASALSGFCLHMHSLQQRVSTCRRALRQPRPCLYAMFGSAFCSCHTPGHVAHLSSAIDTWWTMRIMIVTVVGCACSCMLSCDCSLRQSPVWLNTQAGSTTQPDLHTEKHQVFGVILTNVVRHGVLSTSLQEQRLSGRWHLEQALTQQLQLPHLQ